MPVQVSYPGVYLEEVPSGVRSIVGVPTSVTAFIGRAARGPVNKPVIVYSLGEYQRHFGGLTEYSTMSYAVEDFFRNGGGQAVIVRLFEDSGNNPMTAIITMGNTTLSASGPGAWGNNLFVVIDDNINTDLQAEYGLVAGDMFNMLVYEKQAGVADADLSPLEEHRNMTVQDSPRRLDQILEAYSNLLSAALDPNPQNPATQKFEVQPADDADDGDLLDENSYTGTNFEDLKLGLYALDKTDIVNLLSVPPDFSDPNTPSSYPGNLVATLFGYCEKRDAIFVYDPPPNWTDKSKVVADIDSNVIPRHKNAAIYFPRIRQPDALKSSAPRTGIPSGVMTGVIARTDAERGFWKAPAGIEASLRGVSELDVKLTDDENGALNERGVNCLRSLPVAGRVSWGARTLVGANSLASEWKYLPVRRTALFIRQSLKRGLAWVVHEPNDEPLWAEIRLGIDGFMDSELYRKGAVQGKTRREAYLVKCDAETTTQDDINKGIVNIVVGFAPLKPAEFVIVKLQQMAGQVA